MKLTKSKKAQFDFFDDERDRKRSLGAREKHMLYIKAKRRCEGCGKKLEFESDMQVGHRTAWSKGGRTTWKNCAALCYRCNRLQSTESLDKFRKKMGYDKKEATLQASSEAKLDDLSITQLKSLAKKHGISVKGKRVAGDIFSSAYNKPATKKDYIKKLVKIVKPSELKDIKLAPKKKAVKKRKKKEEGFSLW